MIEIQKGGAVGPEDAVAWLADILGAWHEFTEKEAYAAMADAGIPDALAARAYTFTQVAWGRTLLDGLAVELLRSTFRRDASGTIVESGDLADEPCFAAATRLAEAVQGQPRVQATCHDVGRFPCGEQCPEWRFEARGSGNEPSMPVSLGAILQQAVWRPPGKRSLNTWPRFQNRASWQDPSERSGGGNSGGKRLIDALAAGSAGIRRTDSGVPWFGMPLSPVCQGASAWAGLTGGPWCRGKPDKCPGIDGQVEVDWWPWQRGNRVGRRPRAENPRQPPYRVLRWPKFRSRLAAFCSGRSANGGLNRPFGGPRPVGRFCQGVAHGGLPCYPAFRRSYSTWHAVRPMHNFAPIEGVLGEQFPGRFACQPGKQGHANGLSIRCSGRAGYAFIYEPNQNHQSYLLALRESDEDQNPEVWSTRDAAEVVQRIVPWAFPQAWLLARASRSRAFSQSDCRRSRKGFLPGR